MQHEYNEHYLRALREIAETGAEIYLLGGETLRARSRQQNNGKVRHMAPEFREKVRALCRGSLALSSVAAEQLCRHRAPGSGLTVTSGSKAGTTV